MEYEATDAGLEYQEEEHQAENAQGSSFIDDNTFSDEEPSNYRVVNLQHAKSVKYFEESLYVFATNVRRSYEDAELHYLEREESATEFSNFDRGLVSTQRLTKLKLHKIEL